VLTRIPKPSPWDELELGEYGALSRMTSTARMLGLQRAVGLPPQPKWQEHSFASSVLMCGIAALATPSQGNSFGETANFYAIVRWASAGGLAERCKPPAAVRSNLDADVDLAPNRHTETLRQR